MGLVSEEADGVASLAFYGLHPRHKSTECLFAGVLTGRDETRLL